MAGFEIDGRDYPVPTVFQLTMGEAQVLYDYSGYTLEDFIPPMPDEEDTRLSRLKDPSFKRAMVHIAYQRGNPELEAGAIRAVVDQAPMWETTLSMLVEDEEDPTPDSQRQPEPKNSPSEPSSTEDSGSPSTITSEQRAVRLLRTGTTE